MISSDAKPLLAKSIEVVKLHRHGRKCFKKKKAWFEDRSEAELIRLI